ncbi:hypothetical protein O9993_08910 [Vibrio lentus]|nr:hypothetical protein [Vibrio lentus]
MRKACVINTLPFPANQCKNGRAATSARRFKPDMVVAMGGGSAVIWKR